jgi:CBS domain containing-hemolysin-like protein
MTPREKMFTLPFDSDTSQIVNIVKEQPFSRIPLYKNEKNNIVGILNAKDILSFRLITDVPKTEMTSIMRQPYFVSHDKKVHDLLKEFQEKKIHLALVVNENGNVCGLVTMEDLLEELFGEIYDEFDELAREEK